MNIEDRIINIETELHQIWEFIKLQDQINRMVNNEK